VPTSDAGWCIRRDCRQGTPRVVNSILGLAGALSVVTTPAYGYGANLWVV
jgi:hypothetical protein